MLIGGFEGITLIDFPRSVASVVYTTGCNFLCRYCHNPSLVKCCVNSLFSEDIVLSKINERKNFIDGVVITGGEPCIQSGLIAFIEKIKAFGFAVKLDTNGSRPDIIELLISEKMVDYIAMDIKGPLSLYESIVMTKIDTNNILKSIQLLLQANVDYEFRTTIAKSLLPVESFCEILKIVPFAKKYYLQLFQKTEILDQNFYSEDYSKFELEQIINIFKKNNINALIR